MTDNHEATLAPGKIVEGAAPAAEAEEIKELRIALVCYGGVSLAIYMHGVTKEIHKLVQASTAFEKDPDAHPFASTDTAAVYWKVLKALHAGDVSFRPPPRAPTAASTHQRDPTRTRVVVDIIAGTSAGGINGIFLAKAIAANLSQEPLKDLWLNRGDIAGLLAGPRLLPAWAKAVWFLLKSPVSVALRRDAPPLRGDHMCQWLHSAFTQMDESGPAFPCVESLVPPDQSLNLFVPITDFHGYQREFPIDDPKYVLDRTHRHIVEFRHNPSQNERYVSREYNHVLAFVARATSSFPGAFPAIGFKDYDRNFDTDPRLREVARPLFREYSLAGENPAGTQFIDGGVLDNYPFESAIRTIALKPAVCQVDRRLIYIEPDPVGSRAPEDLKPSPTWLGTIWAGLSSIPRNEPIVDDLNKLARRNEAVARVRDVIEISFGAVEKRVLQYFREKRGLSGLSAVIANIDTYDEIRQAAAELETIAAGEAGYSYATYLRLRTRSLVDNYVNVIGRLRKYPAGSNHLAFVNAVIRLWLVGTRDGDDTTAATTPLFSCAALREDMATTRVESSPERDRQRDFLANVDIWYHERRIRFMIAALNWWYRDRDLATTADVPPPSRASLDATKKRLYDYLKVLDDLLDGLNDDAAVAGLLNEVFDDDAIREAALKQDVKGFVARHRPALDSLSDAVRLGPRIPGLEKDLYDSLRGLCRSWSDETQTALLVRYLGFAFWDILVFPIQATSGVGERDAVETIRVSPRDSTLLDPHGPKLRGNALHHFWAFFTRQGRENDYLWGRLDAAERLIALLLDDPSRPGLEAIDESSRSGLWRECSKDAFVAILNDERSLSTVAPLMANLRQQVNRL